MAWVSKTCAGCRYGYMQVWVQVEILLPASFKTFCSYLSQYLAVLDEQRLVMKGIPMGSWVKPATGMGMGKTPNTCAIP